LAVAALGVIAAGTANGAAFRLHYDPQFSIGGSFDNLGFLGDGEFHISDGCLALTGQIVPNPAPASLCKPSDIGFDSLTLSLYNWTDGPGSILETVSFVPPLNPTIGALTVDFIVADNKVVGIDTGIFGPIQAGPITGGTGAPPLPALSNLWLSFTSNYHLTNAETHTFTYDPQAFLYIGDNCHDNVSGCDTSRPAGVTFTRVSPEVPEPGSIALLLAALGAGWLQWKRRARN
jgi:hypothetical protein